MISYCIVYNSIGEAPYEGVRSNELDSKLQKGLRLKKPEHCDDLYVNITLSLTYLFHKLQLNDVLNLKNFSDVYDVIDAT